MLSQKIPILRDRAEMFSQARQFFKERHVCEVDCPILSAAASIDSNIELIPAQPHSGTRYMHSSPEYSMKRLLAAGMGNIFQLSHVFRNGEQGQRHNPEFTMAEWYRLGFSFLQMVEETVQFIQLFLGNLPTQSLSYRELFQHYMSFDYLTISLEDLLKLLDIWKIERYPAIETEGKDALLNLILGTVIEPQLGTEGLFVLTHYPASQAALSKTCLRGEESVGERFEIYYKGIELANGYHELTDAAEQRTRLMQANADRLKNDKPALPIDENFLHALGQGMPDCAGVAVGFDRLMMLRHHQKQISAVIPFAWEEA